MYVYLDIETSGLNKTSFLLQLSAISEKQHTFDIYIKPPCALNQECTNLTGLSYINNTLYKDGVPLHAVGPYMALLSFYHWTESLRKEGETLDLIGYNSNAFDVPVLVLAYAKFRQTLPTFNECYDVLPVIRKLQKTDDKLAKTKIKLEDLGRFYLPDSEIMSKANFHNSLFDCEILKQVTEKICEDKKTKISDEFGFYKKPFEYFVDKYYTPKVVNNLDPIVSSTFVFNTL